MTPSPDRPRPPPNRPAQSDRPRRDDHQGGPDQRIKQALAQGPKVKFFKEGDRKALRRELVDEEAQRWGERLGEKVATTQLRRFYGDVLALKRRLELDPELPDEMIRSRLALLKAKAAYAARRDQDLLDLLRFIREYGDSVDDRNDFFAFQTVFEAVTAFHRAFENVRRA